MKAMDDYIDVLVTFAGREVAKGRFKVPFSIGKKRGLVSVQIGEDDPAVSRVHAKVDVVDGQLQLIDESTNGTALRGRLLHKQKAPLGEGGTFEIRGYSVTVERARLDPAIPVIVEAQLWLRGEDKKRMSQGIGEMALLFLRTKDGLSFQPVPRTRNIDIDYDQIVGRYKLEGQYPYAWLVADRDRCIFMYVPHESAPAVRINGAPVETRDTLVGPRDTIQIGKARIELHAPGESSLRCVNPKCERLNPYDRRGHCLYCGFRLNEADTKVFGR